LANEIIRAKIQNLIVVHGGGSFGHPLADQYSIKEGFKKKTQIEGFSLTHQAMLELNKLVVDAFIRQGIPAFAISPSSCIITEAGRIKIFYNSPLAKLLAMGCVPVLFGDAILDTEIGFTILSGDQLVSALATRFNADKIVLGVDVDGLYPRDPKTGSSKGLIEQITLRKLKNMMVDIGRAKTVDVTGGMLGKISELIPAITCDVQALIVNASKQDNVYKALKGETVVGTLIRKK
jgi:isopentenyl phosphate kinase